MQSRICSKALPPSVARAFRPERAIGRWQAARRLQHSDASPGSGGGEQHSPDVILGRPAASFAELIEQLDALVKHPNPPRNYGDALAKEELRNIDYRDLSTDSSDKQSEKGLRMLLRQRPKLVRHGQHLVSDSVASEYAEAGRTREKAVAEALDAAGMPVPDAEKGEAVPKDIAINLGITAEQRNRRRIWMSKIAGYREFRSSLLSIDKILDAFDKSNETEGGAEKTGGDNASDDAQSGPSASEDPATADAANDAAVDEDTAKFEKLLRESWRLIDEDFAKAATEASEAGAEASETGAEASEAVEEPSAPGATSDPRADMPGSWPSGARSFHTARRLSKTANTQPPDAPNGTSPPKGFTNDKKRQRMAMRLIRPAIPTPKPTARAPNAKSRAPRSVIRQADMPTHEELRKHVSESKGADGQLHIPITVYANVGDIVDIRVNSSGTSAVPFGARVDLAAILQRTTGRFQYSAIRAAGDILGTRPKALGFMSKGLLFDNEFLRKGGVNKRDARRILAYGEALREDAGVGGQGALTNATAVERLQQAHNQKIVQPVASSLLDDAQVDNLDSIASEVGDEESLLGQVVMDENGASTVASMHAEVDGAGHTAGSDAQADAAESEDELLCILRVVPRALRIFEEGAERLMRSNYRELSGYWSMAVDQGQTSVTVDALADLMFEASNSRFARETARLAAYMHLAGNPLHFVPGEDSLFFTQVFELRPRHDVEEIKSVRDMIRRNAPEFRRFVDKAQKLVAYSYARGPASPLNTSLSPTAKAAKASLACAITGWSVSVDFAETRWAGNVSRAAEEDAKRIVFDESDHKFIHILRRFIHHSNYGYAYTRNPYASFVAPIVKKIGPYTEGDISTAVRFLVDIGVNPHWHNPRLNFRSLPFEPDSGSDTAMLDAASESYAQRYLAGDPAAVDVGTDAGSGDPLREATPREAQTAEVSEPTEAPRSASPLVPGRLDPAKQDSVLMQSSSGVGVIDRTKLYGRDICEDIRHDFGDLPVYTIDDAATRDVDDGISLETVRGADGELHKWLHVHVADPTALIHPGHAIVDAAYERMTTLYFAEKTTHMLPFDLTLKEISLARRNDGKPTKTLTFSARIGEDGDIVDYKVRAGLVRNITAVPYELADKYLSYSRTLGDIDSLSKLQDSVRHGTLIHPFSPDEAEAGALRHYGEGCGELPSSAVQVMLELQQIAQRHIDYHIRAGSFSRIAKEPSVSVAFGSSQWATDAGKPALLRQSPGDHGYLATPQISTSTTYLSFSPAHRMVSETMTIACRVAARYASEHASPAGYGQGINSVGEAANWRTIPLLYRAQEGPNLAMLPGCSQTMPLAFDGLSAEDAQSAENVWEAYIRLAKANGGFVEIKHHDEVRYMMNPGIFTEAPGVHCGMGLFDSYGYTRVTSPIRRMDDLVGHWQLKAHLLAEHGDGRDKAPWFWKHEDMSRLAPIVFRKHYMAAKCMKLNSTYWAIATVQRMEFEARRGTLQLPPAGFYNPSSPNYHDNPFAYYNPQQPGPLVWTAIVDNRDETRVFVSVILEGIGTLAMLIPRPLSPLNQPFAGTKVRVQIIAADPVQGLLMAKLAPEELQPAETPRFWSTSYALNATPEMLSSVRIPPESTRVVQSG
ncbi:3'-5' RNA exonuclease complex component [Coemansia biformis]|uniref:3'-5' RNA exonuclease complex component n=1 Tax=Coemansia biformis TaxID=1286918 RepID=A0A9W7YHJ2_9FUNG|nr:3'-5' RNA exonuclease complex component [Coemansia biformis]